MLKRLSQLWLLLLLAVTGFAQDLQRYEYWVDSDYSQHTTIGTTTSNIVFDIDVSRLDMGVHFLNFRAQNRGGDWGTFSRYLFFVSDMPNEKATITDYEYWIDGNYQAKQTAKSAGEQVTTNIDVSQLPMGVHYFNFRAKNSDGVWGNLSRYLFFVSDMPNDKATVTDYEYWIDGDYQAKRVSKVFGGNIITDFDVSQLPMGVHYFNFRAKNSDGVWGNLSRYLFFVSDMPSDNATITDVEYWLDADYNNKVDVKSSKSDFFTLIDVSLVEPGVHYFNFRAKNSDGVWGNLSRYLVYVPADEGDTDSPLVGYRYNFNQQYTYVPIADRRDYELNNLVLDIPDLIETGALDEGCDYTFDSSANNVTLRRKTNVSFAMQFKNKADVWSAPAAALFEMGDTLTRHMEELKLQRSVSFTKPSLGDFCAFKMTINENRNYFFRSTQSCQVMLFEGNGSLLTTMSADALLNTYQTGLTSGTYYGIVYNMVKNDANRDEQLSLKLMLTNNIVPTPTISYENEVVTMTCEQEDATIYYTLDGTEPTAASLPYIAPFELKHNALIKVVALYPDMTDSDIASLTVDSYKVIAPQVEIINLQLYMNCPTEGSAIFFTLDGTDPTANGQRYTEPVAISGDCVVKAVAKREGYNNSDVTNFVVDTSNIKTSKPSIVNDGNNLIVSSLTNGAIFYYTLDGTIPSASSSKTDHWITVDHNCIVTVVAMKEGELPSDPVRFTVDWLQVETPVLSFSNGMLTMNCGTPGASIYYAIGDGTPLMLYTEPITLTDNRMVTAIAKAKDLLDSKSATYNPNSFTCEPVIISYNGRDLTLTTATEGATIYYTTDGRQPGSSSNTYGSMLTVSQLFTIKAIAIKPNTNSSIVTTYTIPAYFDGKQAQIADAGQLSVAFQWCDANEVETVTVSGLINDADLTILRNMNSLKHLDLNNVQLLTESLPDGAFAGMKQLLSISLPQRLSSVGTGIFSGCQQLAAITWNASIRLSETALSGFSNPNLLLYVRTTTDAPSSVRNVVANGVATSITLTDAEGNANFYCPTAFTAQHVSYQHQYTMPTVVNQCRGWETIALPFTVQRVSHPVNGVAAPFAKDDASAKPFWLCRLTETGFVPTATIEAYQPYIISMPNNSYYADAYMLGGTITFEADNALIEPQPATAYPQKGEFLFVPSLTATPKASYVLPINRNEAFSGFPEGSNFFRDLERDVRPFEAYILSAAKASRFAIIDDEHDAATAITDLMPSPTARHRVYDLQGRLLMVTDDPSPAALRQRLGTGLYIVDSKKLYVK